MAIKYSYQLLKIYEEPVIGKRCKIQAVRLGTVQDVLTSPIEDFYVSEYRNFIRTANSIYQGNDEVEKIYETV